MTQRNVVLNSVGRTHRGAHDNHGIRPLPTGPKPSEWSERAAQRTWRTIGAVFVAVGLINAFIPVLPTTVFLLLGVWAYGKGDPALRRKLLQHPQYGRSLKLWVEQRQISRKGKIGSISSIVISGAITVAVLGARPLMWAVCGGLTLLSIYLATRPEPSAHMP